MLEVEETPLPSQKYLIYGACAVGLIALVISVVAGYFLGKGEQKSSTVTPVSHSSSSVSFFGAIYVDINGAVKKPGLYHLSLPIRVADVINQAGGLVSGADLKYVAEKLDLARKVKDEEKIYIPFKGEALPPFSQQEDGGNNLVSINTASSDQLQTLPSISKKRADAIIRLRPYSSVDDFRQKTKISTKIFQEIQALISL